MATAMSPEDVTSVCSVCLEPYANRNPKLLPCFHTFCLACLKDLELHHKRVSHSTTIYEEHEEDQGHVTFHCPTCSAVITVPPGGVSQFEEIKIRSCRTYFKLSDNIISCDVCNRGQEATCSCTECGHNMCDECQQWHDKFLSNHKVQLLTSSCQQFAESSPNPDCLATRNEHLKVLEAALVAMREEEDMLQRERQAVADVISRRADAVRALVTQAEERSQRALVEVGETLATQIKDEIITAGDRHAKIWQLSSQRGINGQVTVAFRQWQKDLLSDEDFRYFQQRGRRRKLLHQFNDCAIDLQTVESYLGTVCGDQQITGNTDSILLSSTEGSRGKAAERSECDTNATSQPSDTTVRTMDAADENHRLQRLETLSGSGSTHSVETDTEMFKEEISKLQTTVAALKEEDSNMQQNINRFNEDFVNMKKGMISMEGTLMASLSRLQKGISTIESIKHESDQLHMDVAAVKEQLLSIQQSIITSKDISSIQQDMASLQEKLIVDSTMVQKDIKAIQEISSDHSRKIQFFQYDFILLAEDLRSFKEKSCNMVAFHAELKKNMETSYEWKPIILQTDNCNLGQAYDTKTGVFTVPVAGTYFFMARTVRNEGSGYCSLAISIDRCKTTSSVSHYGKLQAGVGCTVHVVQRLTPGQKVSLMAYGRAKLPGCATFFSGMLVRPDVDLS